MKNKIPKGDKCFDGNGICPFHTEMEVNGVRIPWCKYLMQGGLPNVDSDTMSKLNFRFGNEEETLNGLPLDLLNDKIKCCNEN